MDLMLRARDGVKLAATLFDATPPFRGGLLLNGGTGIPRQFYAAFAPLTNQLQSSARQHTWSEQKHQVW